MCRILNFLGFLTLINIATVLGSSPKLKLVNVVGRNNQYYMVFRHGDRTPDEIETYPTDPYGNYTYFPTGRGGLTNVGKRREYHLGELLKSRYGRFLGPVYYPAVLEARSTDYDRTKMSLQLVLSALYPPTNLQRWDNDLSWQPIPTTYRPLEEDSLLYPEMQEQYITEYNRVRNSSEVMEKVAELNGLMESLGKYTGMNITDPSAIDNLYHGFAATESAGLRLPDWVCRFYPHGGILRGTDLYYKMMSYNDELKRLNGGVVLSKILSDASSLRNGTLEKGKKLFLYSGHESNVASLLSALGVYKPHVPAYSSAVIIELWKHNKEYYLKVLYYTGIPSGIFTQKIPGCSEVCRMNKFLELLEPVTDLNR